MCFLFEVLFYQAAGLYCQNVLSHPGSGGPSASGAIMSVLILVQRYEGMAPDPRVPLSAVSNVEAMKQKWVILPTGRNLPSSSSKTEPPLLV